jgi:hypothetical protein
MTPSPEKEQDLTWHLLKGFLGISLFLVTYFTEKGDISFLFLF